MGDKTKNLNKRTPIIFAGSSDGCPGLSSFIFLVYLSQKYPINFSETGVPLEKSIIGAVFLALLGGFAWPVALIILFFSWLKPGLDYNPSNLQTIRYPPGKREWQSKEETDRQIRLKREHGEREKSYKEREGLLKERETRRPTKSEHNVGKQVGNESEEHENLSWKDYLMYAFFLYMFGGLIYLFFIK